MYKKQFNRRQIYGSSFKRIATRNPKVFIYILLVLLAISIGCFSYLLITKSIGHKNEISEYKNRITTLHDSLTYELDYARTLSEKCHVYTEIGKVSVERDKTYVINEDSVWSYIQSLDVWYPEYIMAQAVIESQCGKLTPNKSHNLFGMTIPRTRETTALPPTSKNDVYARYKNWKMSVIDRVLWELAVFNNIKPTEEQYLKKIESYATSPTYLDSVKSKAKQIKKKK